ncbi:hypothetical protein ACVNF4_20345, partial [Streptomyces sp. S6]
NLDSRAGEEVLGLLGRTARETGRAVVMVTHDPSAAAHADEVVFLADGRLVDRMRAPTAERVLDRVKAFETRAGRVTGARTPSREPRSAGQGATMDDTGRTGPTPAGAAPARSGEARP